MNLQIIIYILGAALSVSAVDLDYLQPHTLHYNDPIVDEKKVVCDALKVPPETDHETFYKLSKSNYTALGYDDVLKLTVWNMKRGFKYRKIDNQLSFPAENWRKIILDDIFDIFKLACHNAYVPGEFLNIVYEMIMIYYNNAVPKIKENMDRWNSTSAILEHCKIEMHQLPLHDIAGTIITMAIDGHEVDLYAPAEMADVLPNIDIFVDTLWFVFSFSYGACYYPAGYRSVWAPKYKKYFYEDFIVPLLHHWVNPGLHVDFGVITGNFDISHIMQNVRSCTTAAYTMYAIQDRELIRPIRSPEGDPNFKTGDTVMDEDDDDNDIDYY